MSEAIITLFAITAILAIWRIIDAHDQTKTNTVYQNYSPPQKSKAQSNIAVRTQLKDLPMAKVTWVVDGDTVIISKGWSEITIRLDSIDCPEDGQHWGDIAKYGLMKLIAKKNIYIEEHGFDDYGRTLATIYVWHDKKNEWLNVNEHMVTLGHAWVTRGFYDHLPKDRQEKLNRLEKWAQSKKIGLWREPNPIAPWHWRKEGQV